ncbi:MAG: lysophospholipid acyltransferase family protein [Endomicrobiia bacterium]|nr:lysophospholipid acyltransferase family protein [Endomicrobiia bacterium]
MTPIYSFLSWFVINLWSATLRIKRFGEEKYSALHLKISGAKSPSERPSDPVVIFAFFHGEQFVLYRGHHRRCGGRGIAIMTSLSRDGELQNGILRRFGYETIRGSSSRGGARALIGMINALRNGYSAAFAADGPRGPAREVKPGVVYLAMKTGSPIVPLRVFYTRSKVLKKTWDMYRVPMPFSKVVIVYGEPIYIDGNPDEQEISLKCRRIEQSLDAIVPPPEAADFLRAGIL